MKTHKKLKGIKTAVEVTPIKKHKFSVTETDITVFIHSDLNDFTFVFLLLISFFLCVDNTVDY